MAASSKSKNHKPIAANGRAALLAQDFHEVGDAARRIASDGMGAIRETAEEYFEQGRHRVRGVGERMQAEVTERPNRAILLAVAVGFLVGAFFSRR